MDPRQVVAMWTAIHDGVYRSAVRRRDPGSPDYSGCRSGITGLDYPDAHMDEWARAAVDQVLALRPASVLEVGAGSGILALPIASAVERYLGCDVAASAVELLRQLPLPPGRASFETRAADDLSGLSRFDVILLHSVLHYFPDADYLRRSIAEAVDHLNPAGSVVLGDVVDYRLRTAYRLEGLAARATRTMTPGEVFEDLARRARVDVELTVSPAALADIGAEHGLRAAVRLKPGVLPNEFNVYRYDVQLRVDPTGLLDPAALVHYPWEQAPPPGQWPGLAPFVLSGVPHPAQRRALDALARLEREPDGQAWDLAELLVAYERGVAPARWHTLATEHGLTVIAVPSPGRLGCYDAVVSPPGPTGVLFRPAADDEQGIAQPLEAVSRRATTRAGR